MTQNRDFKKLVRARMARTGESYTAARAQLRPPANDPVGVAPAKADPVDLAALAGMSDAAVAAKTGRTWAEWAAALDAHGARDLDHTCIASLVRERWPEIGPWWAQTVTVGYERIRGLRQHGQLCNGDFAASKSKTFPVPIATLFAAFGDARASWIGAPTELRTARPGRSMRLTWPDGTIVAIGFTDKGPNKSAVSIQHTKLESAARRGAEKQAWAERLARLAELL